MSTPISTWDTNRRWVRTWVVRSPRGQRLGHRPGSGRCTGQDLGAALTGTWTPDAPRVGVPGDPIPISPSSMPHRVPEDGQEGSLEEDAELCEGAGGKGVALDGVHFLGEDIISSELTAAPALPAGSPAGRASPLSWP